MPRLTAFISGMVQKTGYRARVVILANAFGLQGYVQNLPSGMVKVVAEGEQTDLERFLNSLNIKDALIDVRQEVNNTGEMLAKKIDDAKVEIANEVKELRSGLRDDLKARLIRIEADISQMKARNSL
jgi:acylphosphatase